MTTAPETNCTDQTIWTGDNLDIATDLKYKLAHRASYGANTMSSGSGWLEDSISDLCEFISKIAVWGKDVAEVGGAKGGSWTILPHSHVRVAAGSEELVRIVATAAEMAEGRLSAAGEEVCQLQVKLLDKVFDIGPTHHKNFCQNGE